jgi:hypothetical protein
VIGKKGKFSNNFMGLGFFEKIQESKNLTKNIRFRLGSVLKIKIKR